VSSLATSAQVALWGLIFNGTQWPGIAQNASALSAATQLFVSLHNGDPSAGGGQETFETQYPNYARVGVNRVAGQWAIVGSDPVVSMNVNPITFPQCGGIGDTLTFWGIGLSPTGSAPLIVSGPIGSGPVSGFSADASGNLMVPGNALAINDTLILYGLGPGLNLPAGLDEGVEYYVGNLLGNIVTLSLEPDNAMPVPTITSGCGLLVPTAPLSLIINQTVPSFPANGLTAFLN
jgi:hypothetical protein